MRLATPTSSSQTPDRPLPADYGRSTQKNTVNNKHVRFVRCYVNLALQRIHLTRQKKRGTLKVFLGVSVLLVLSLYGWDARKKRSWNFFLRDFSFSFLGSILIFSFLCLLGRR